jgi:hypothetical protein
MTWRKQEDNGSWRRKLRIALFGELSLERAMDLSQDRLLLHFSRSIASSKTTPSMHEKSHTCIVFAGKLQSYFQLRVYNAHKCHTFLWLVIAAVRWSTMKYCRNVVKSRRYIITLNRFGLIIHIVLFLINISRITFVSCRKWTLKDRVTFWVSLYDDKWQVYLFSTLNKEPTLVSAQFVLLSRLHTTRFTSASRVVSLSNYKYLEWKYPAITFAE